MPHVLKGFNIVSGLVESVCSIRNRIVTLGDEAGSVQEGKLYSHHAKISVPSDGSHNHLIQIDSGKHRLQNYSFNSTVGPCDMFLYEAPFTDVNSLGTAGVFYNRNRESLNVSSSGFFVNPFIDVNSIGTQLEYQLIENTSGGNNKPVGGGASGLREWVLKPSTDYLLRFVNNDGANAATVGLSIILVDES